MVCFELVLCVGYESVCILLLYTSVYITELKIAKNRNKNWTYAQKRKTSYYCDHNSMRFFWWRRSGSNRLPLECHSSALPGELRPRIKEIIKKQKYISIKTTACSNFFVRTSLRKSLNSITGHAKATTTGAV